MGIRGLTTFLATYAEHYTETKYFYDTTVVIDGNNLLNYLHRHPPPDNYHLIVGNYPFYARSVRKFFQNVKACGITPIVIFDGAYEIEKMITVEQRYRENMIKNVHHSVPGNTYLPKCASIVFHEILAEQNLMDLQTQFEADDTIAYIGKKLGCPVLSSDSDFYIYPDLKWVVPLESIEFRKAYIKGGANGTTTKRFVLAAKFISMKKLCKNEFKFDDLRLLPLIAVILGNDRIPPYTFANFHKSKSDNKYDRFKYLFKKMGEYGDYEDVYTKMIQSLKMDKRTEIQAQVDAILLGYSGENGEKLVWNFVKDKIGLKVSDEIVDEKETSLLDLPKWFIDEHLNSKLPATFLQVYANKILFLPPQVEIPYLPSTHDLSLPILGIMCGLVIGANEMICVSRERKQVVKNKLMISTKLLMELPNLHNPNFRNKGQSILLDAFQLTEDQRQFVHSWPPGIKLVIISLLYFSGKIGLNKSSFSGSIIVGVLLSFLKPFIETNNSKPSQEDNSTTSGYLKKQYMTKTLKEFYDKFDKVPYFGRSARRTYDIRYSYAYSQFQNVLYQGVMFCKLLGNPFKLPKVSFMDSCLVYNICDNVHDDYVNEINTFVRINFKNDLPIMNLLNSVFSNVTYTPITNCIQEKSENANDNEEEDDSSDSVPSCSSDNGNAVEISQVLIL